MTGTPSCIKDTLIQDKNPCGSRVGGGGGWLINLTINSSGEFFGHEKSVNFQKSREHSKSWDVPSFVNDKMGRGWMK